jgi:hypothetical protein
MNATCRVCGSIGDRRFSIALPLSQALAETGKREGVPTATVFPCPSDLKIGVFEKPPNAPVCELVTILGVNGFASHEVNIEARVLDAYMLLLRALDASRSETRWNSKAHDDGSKRRQSWPLVLY